MEFRLIRMGFCPARPKDGTLSRERAQLSRAAAKSADGWGEYVYRPCNSPHQDPGTGPVLYQAGTVSCTRPVQSTVPVPVIVFNEIAFFAQQIKGEKG
jgi:hypothetical protein